MYGRDHHNIVKQLSSNLKKVYPCSYQKIWYYPKPQEVGKIDKDADDKYPGRDMPEISQSTG